MRDEYEYLLSLGDRIGQYAGKWIAIVDEEIVAAGNSAREVFEIAKRKYPDKEPMILKLPDEEMLLEEVIRE